MFKGIYVIGTDTDVGKTVISAGITTTLMSKGNNTCYFKPISSGGEEVNGEFLSHDALFVKSISGLIETHDNINPYRFKTPVSPHLAASMENNEINIDFILNKYKELQNKYDYLVVEGCGGLAVPLIDDGYMQYDLIKAFDIGCILVAKTTLGTINHTILTLKLAQSMGINIYGIIFNGYDGSYLEDDNIKTIKKLIDLPIIGVIPKIEGIDTQTLQVEEFKAIFEKEFYNIGEKCKIL